MRLSPQNLIATVGFALLAATACVFAFGSKFVQPLTVLTSSVTTEATLDDRYQERTSRRSGITSTSYNVTYSFTANGKTYRGSSAIDTPPTPTMTVMYLAEDPNTNRLDLKAHAWIDLAFFVVPAVVLLIAILALVLHVRSPVVSDAVGRHPMA